MIFDNALTRAQTALRAALPMDWQVQRLDLVPANWSMFLLEVWYPVDDDARVVRLFAPMHLLYDAECLVGQVIQHDQGVC